MRYDYGYRAKRAVARALRFVRFRHNRFIFGNRVVFDNRFARFVRYDMDIGGILHGLPLPHLSNGEVPEDVGYRDSGK